MIETKYSSGGTKWSYTEEVKNKTVILMQNSNIVVDDDFLEVVGQIEGALCQ